MHFTPLTLIHNGETCTLFLARLKDGGGRVFMGSPEHRQLVAKGAVIGLDRKNKGRNWQVVSEITGNAYGGDTLQKAATQLFYSEVDKWPAPAKRQTPAV